MNIFKLPLYYRYIVFLYSKNLLAVLFGLSFAFAFIDYFQHAEALTVSTNYKILYVFYIWEESLALLYPLAMVFALIMTKLSLIKSSTMGALHSFGYTKRRLLRPILAIATMVYVVFSLLHTTEFSYAKDKANVILDQEIGKYDIKDLFFKYNDTFVYINRLDPFNKVIDDITIFTVENQKVIYTLNAPSALFEDNIWIAKNATVKVHIYDDNGQLTNYLTEYKVAIETLKGYKPHIIESLHEGKALNIIDAYSTYRLLDSQGLNTDKIRSVIYTKLVTPLFAIAMIVILFFKLPFHARMLNMGLVISISLGSTFMIWGLFFGLGQVSMNGVTIPEYAIVLPIGLLLTYAFYIFTFKNSNISS